MEAITVRITDGRQMARFRKFFEREGVRWSAPEKNETLEEKIVRLYAEGHYTDAEMKTFFSIPKAHRVDPFDLSPSGDVYYADQRNVDYVNKSIALGREDLKEGRCVELDIHNLRESIRSLSGRVTANE